MRYIIFIIFIILLLSCKDNKFSSEFCKINHSNGQIHGMGFFSHDKLPEGLWMFWDKDGNPWEKGYFVNGKKNGRWEVFDKNGRLIELKNYKNGILNGIFIEYDYKTGIKKETIMQNNFSVGMIKNIGLFKDTIYYTISDRTKIGGDYDHFTDKIVVR